MDILVYFETETQIVTVTPTSTATVPCTEIEPMVETNSLTIMVTSASADQCSQLDSSMETQTVTISASPTFAITNSQVGFRLCTAETETVTISHPLTTTVMVNHTPDNDMVDRSSNCNGSQTLWMVFAILFIVIAVSTIVFSLFVMYFSHKKFKTLENSTTAMSTANTKELLVREGKFNRNQ